MGLKSKELIDKLVLDCLNAFGYWKRVLNDETSDDGFVIMALDLLPRNINKW